MSWWQRGENATATRRAELRKLAYARIDADRKAAGQLVESWGADTLTALLAGGLSSADAKAFLERLPSPEALLPSVRITPELEIRTGPHPSALHALGSQAHQGQRLAREGEQ